MKTLNKNTKQAQYIINAYKYAKYLSVLTAYKNPSYYKITAERKILNEMKNKNGYGYLITGFNCCTFSCGYLYNIDGKKYLMYYTHTNCYRVEYEN